jgi:hypothetical protein
MIAVAVALATSTACAKDREDAATASRRCGLPSPQASIPIDEQLVFIPTLELALVVTFTDPPALETFTEEYKQRLVGDAAFRSLMTGVIVNSGVEGRLLVFDFDPGAASAMDVCSVFDALRTELGSAEVQFVAT